MKQKQKQAARVLDGRPVQYYWAYGSNLCIKAMKNRCPRAEPVGRLMMPSGKLVFRGVADVIRDYDEVPGALWRITPECEMKLDGYEGVKYNKKGASTGLYNKRYVLIAIGGLKYDCLFYQMNVEREELGIYPPTQAYLSVIEQGYKDFQLPMEYLQGAIAHSWDDKNPSKYNIARHVRHGKPTLARASEHEAKPSVILLPAPDDWRQPAQTAWDKRRG